MMRNPVGLWLEHAKEFVGETSILRNKLLVDFNRWFSVPQYRQELAHIVGRPFSDRALQHIPRNGGGSSFNGFTFDGRAQKMDVLDRWKMYRHEPRFHKLIEEPDVWRLTESIFGVPAAISSWDESRRRKRVSDGVRSADRSFNFLR